MGVSVIARKSGEKTVGLGQGQQAAGRSEVMGQVENIRRRHTRRQEVRNEYNRFGGKVRSSEELGI